MSPRIRERQLIHPACKIIAKNGGSIQTSVLIAKLWHLMRPKNGDLDGLKNRNDVKFTQIVRNLKSHKTLFKLGYVKEVPGGFSLTPLGFIYALIP